MKKIILEIKNITKLIKQFLLHVNTGYKYSYTKLSSLIIFGTVMEMCSLGMVIPFIGIIFFPEKINSQPFLMYFINLFNLNSNIEYVVFYTTCITSIILISSITRTIIMKTNLNLSANVNAHVSSMIYKKLLYQPYHIHLSKNSSEFISLTLNKTNQVVSGVFLQFLGLLSSGVLLVFVSLTLFIINVKAFLFLSLSFIIGYGMLTLFVRDRLQKYGTQVSLSNNLAIKNLQEGIGGIRDIILDGTQNIFCDNFTKTVEKLRFSESNISFFIQSPRFLMESFGLTCLIGLAGVLFYKEYNSVQIVSILGVFGLGAQRLLPLLQQCYSSISSILSNKATMQDIVSILNTPTKEEENNVKPIEIKSIIQMQKIFFDYSDSHTTLIKNFHISILRGTRMGIIGNTGSGKSTILDILMCLLEPKSGEVKVDNIAITKDNVRAWQKSIAHVPQNIYLTDGTIADNIAFGCSSVDMSRVQRAAEQAHLKEFIMSKPDKYNTLIGERGIRLSGGQRQRLGIARALYKNASVLIFDEATSALDNDTEECILKSINQLNKDLTIIFVTHRQSFLKYCDVIVELKNGEIVSKNHDEYMEKLC